MSKYQEYIKFCIEKYRIDEFNRKLIGEDVTDIIVRLNNESKQIMLALGIITGQVETRLNGRCEIVFRKAA